jgi:mannose-6-phosphate isomerase-like protein (cupin superfamily)
MHPDLRLNLMKIADGPHPSLLLEGEGSERSHSMAVTAEPKAEVFSIRTPLLSAGRTTNFVARSDMMSVAIKVYAEGGENAAHCHATEDHAFIILEGEATFYDRDDTPRVVHQYEGILIPKGVYYWFQSSGDTNLVLLRTAGFGAGEKRGDDRLDPFGQPLPAESAENKHITGVPIPGQFFGD